MKTWQVEKIIGLFVTILLSQCLSYKGIHEFHILDFPILFHFIYFFMLSFFFMNFLSPFSSLHKTDALIFRHKAILLDEGGNEKEKTAGIQTFFTGLLGNLKYYLDCLLKKVAQVKYYYLSAFVCDITVQSDSWKRALHLLFLFLSLNVFQMLHKVPENLNGTKLHYIF